MKITWKKKSKNEWEAFVKGQYVGAIRRVKDEYGHWGYIVFGSDDVELFGRFRELRDAKSRVRVA